MMYVQFCNEAKSCTLACKRDPMVRDRDIRFSIRDEIETLPRFLETETRPRRLETRLETVSRPRRRDRDYIPESRVHHPAAATATVGQPPSPATGGRGKVAGHDHTKTTGRQDRRRCNRTAQLVIRPTSGHSAGLITAGAVPSPVPMLKSNEQLSRAILPPTHQGPSVETRRLSTQAMGKMWNGMCGTTVIGHDITYRQT